MSVLTKEEVESLLAAALEEKERLRTINRELIRENSELLLIRRCNRQNKSWQRYG